MFTWTHKDAVNISHIENAKYGSTWTFQFHSGFHLEIACELQIQFVWFRPPGKERRHGKHTFRINILYQPHKRELTLLLQWAQILLIHPWLLPSFPSTRKLLHLRLEGLWAQQWHSSVLLKWQTHGSLTASCKTCGIFRQEKSNRNVSRGHRVQGPEPVLSLEKQKMKSSLENVPRNGPACYHTCIKFLFVCAVLKIMSSRNLFSWEWNEKYVKWYKKSDNE